jgi:hypothetical protein
VKASLARVAARRRGMASGATVMRTSRVDGVLDRRVAIRAAPAAIPRISPIARKAISVAVTPWPTPSDRAPHRARAVPPSASVAADRRERQPSCTADVPVWRGPGRSAGAYAPAHASLQPIRARW